ncbi:MAG: SLC13 family permease [Pseudomonadota bacterium]
MTAAALFVFALLAVAIVLFATNALPMDVVALLLLLSLLLGDVVTVPQALAGFGDPVVLMIAGLFVVGEALVTTGIAARVGAFLVRVGGASETRLILALMLTVGFGGAFVSSTGVVAIFIPIVLGIAAKTGVARAKLMLPLAFAALISGMMTLISTPPNLVVNAELRLQELQPFGFFAFTPIGLAVLVIGVVYMLAVGRWLVPDQALPSGDARRGRTIAELAAVYGLTDRVHWVRIPWTSPCVGQTIGEASLRTRYGVSIVAFGRGSGRDLEVTPALTQSRFRANDLVIAVGEPERIERFVTENALVAVPSSTIDASAFVKEMGVAEVMVAPDSALIGKTLVEAAFRSRRRVNVLAIRRMGQPLEGTLAEERLALGDALLVSGRWQDLRSLLEERGDFVTLSLPNEVDDVAPAHRAAPQAVAILVAMVAAMTFQLVPNVAAVMLAAVAMILAGCIPRPAAYASINWPSLVLIAGMLPMATALQNTGATDLMVAGLVESLGGFGSLAMLAGLFVLTAALGMFISNTATAVLVAPIAIGVAADLGVSPYPFAMTVAVAASAAFMTPVSSPVNTLVVDPGGYRFVDFVKVGVPMTLLVMVVTMLVVPMLFPLGGP